MLLVFLLPILALSAEASLLSGSCVGRCGDNLDSSKSCQCNVHCTRYGDCCPDYSSACTGGSGSGNDITDAELLRLGDQLWNADHQRFLPSDIGLSIDTEGRLFSWVNEAKLEGTSYALFINLLNNYNPFNGEVEPPLTSVEATETLQFLNHVVASDVMQIVEEVLVRAGKVDRNGMINTLRELWFDFYGRSSSMNFADSSGFEHVFVGEKKSTKVNGFHSWVQMYLLEKTGNIEYLGSNSEAEPSLLEVRLLWDGLLKERASMFVGTSPEFDMALYTLCMLARPGQRCTTRIAGNTVNIQTYDVSHVSGLQVATAFPMV